MGRQQRRKAREPQVIDLPWVAREEMPSSQELLRSVAAVYADIEALIGPRPTNAEGGDANAQSDSADEGAMAALQTAQLEDLDEARRELYVQIGSALKGINRLTGQAPETALHAIGCPEEAFETKTALDTSTSKLRWIASVLIAIRDACETLRDIGLSPDDAWHVAGAAELIAALDQVKWDFRSAEAVALVLQSPLVESQPLRSRA